MVPTGEVVWDLGLTRTSQDFAAHLLHVARQVRGWQGVTWVLDNLNTHSPASFYEAFEPAEAWRLSQKLEIHYTPLHGSWLNMAEIELSVLARQAVPGRMATMQHVHERVAAWQQARNRQQASIHWRFTSQDARIKLKRLYPSNEP